MDLDIMEEYNSQDEEDSDYERELEIALYSQIHFDPAPELSQQQLGNSYISIESSPVNSPFNVEVKEISLPSYRSIHSGKVNQSSNGPKHEWLSGSSHSNQSKQILKFINNNVDSVMSITSSNDDNEEKNYSCHNSASDRSKRGSRGENGKFTTSSISQNQRKDLFEISDDLQPSSIKYVQGNRQSDSIIDSEDEDSANHSFDGKEFSSKQSYFDGKFEDFNKEDAILSDDYSHLEKSMPMLDHQSESNDFLILDDYSKIEKSLSQDYLEELTVTHFGTTQVDPTAVVISDIDNESENAFSLETKSPENFHVYSNYFPKEKGETSKLSESECLSFTISKSTTVFHQYTSSSDEIPPMIKGDEYTTVPQSNSTKKDKMLTSSDDILSFSTSSKTTDTSYATKRSSALLSISKRENAEDELKFKKRKLSKQEVAVKKRKPPVYLRRPPVVKVSYEQDSDTNTEYSDSDISHVSSPEKIMKNFKKKTVAQYGGGKRSQGSSSSDNDNGDDIVEEENAVKRIPSFKISK